MKRLLYLSCGMAFFLAGSVFLISCNSANKTNGQNTPDNDSSTAISFESKVAYFDSTWANTMAVLDTRIHQWDSSSQTYRGSLKDKLQSKITKIKAQRDSLKEKVGQAGDQTEAGWNDFRQDVSSRYDSILTGIQQLSKDIQ